jgi:hypothetical protein
MFSTLGNGSINLIHRHQWTPDLIIVDEAAQVGVCVILFNEKGLFTGDGM